MASVRDSVLGDFNSSGGGSLDTSAIAWASGDFTLAFTSIPAGATLSSIAGSTDDTYAELEHLSGSNIDFYLHDGTITDPFDAAVDYVTSIDRNMVAGVANVQDTTGIDVQSPGETGTSTTPTSASVTTTVDDCLVISVFGVGGSHTLANITVPSGYTLIGKVVTTDDSRPTATNHATMAIAAKVQAAAGATGAAQWGGLDASVDWAASTIAFAPTDTGIDASGDLEAAAATAEGEAAVLVSGSGALAAPDSAVAAAGGVVVGAGGALAAEDSTAAGTASTGDEINGSGSPQAQGSTVSASGSVIVSGSGTLQASAAGVEGEGGWPPDIIAAPLDQQPLDWIEVELDRCQLVYSEAPCQAQLGVTGQHKCFNSFATCQDRENFDPATYWVRFSEATTELPRLQDFTEDGVGHWLPLISDIRHSPVKPDPGQSIGVRAELQVTLQDAPYHDIGLDKYVSERGFDAIERSTLWLKLLTRFPHYVGRRLRWHRGFIGEEFVTREYVIEKVSGPDRRGRIKVSAKDPLKLADNKRAQAPRPSQGVLVSDLAEGSSPSTIDVETPNTSEYPAGGGIVFLGKEGIQYTSTTIVDDVTVRLNGITRGLPDGYITEAEDHDAGDTVQLALYYNGETLTDIVHDLLTTYVPRFDPAWIDKAEWDDENVTWNGGLTLRRLIAEPEGVVELIDEIVEQTMTWGFWWDEEARLIRYRAFRPADVDEVVQAFSDDNHLIAGTVERVDEPDRVANEVQVIFGLLDPTENRDERKNYSRASVRIDVESQSDNEFGQRRVHRVFSRWHPAGNEAFVDQLTVRVLAQRATKTFRIDFALTRRDGEDLKLADFADLTTLWLIDELGLPVETRVQVIRAEIGEDELSFQAREDIFALTGRAFARWAPAELEGLLWADATDDQRDRYLFWADADGLMSDGSEGYQWL